MSSMSVPISIPFHFTIVPVSIYPSLQLRDREFLYCSTSNFEVHYILREREREFIFIFHIFFVYSQLWQPLKYLQLFVGQSVLKVYCKYLKKRSSTSQTNAPTSFSLLRESESPFLLIQSTRISDIEIFSGAVFCTFCCKGGRCEVLFEWNIHFYVYRCLFMIVIFPNYTGKITFTFIFLS